MILQRPGNRALIIDWNSISTLEKDSFRGGICLGFIFHVTYASDNKAVVEMHIGMQGVT